MNVDERVAEWSNEIPVTLRPPKVSIREEADKEVYECILLDEGEPPGYATWILRGTEPIRYSVGYRVYFRHQFVRISIEILKSRKEGFLCFGVNALGNDSMPKNLYEATEASDADKFSSDLKDSETNVWIIVSACLLAIIIITIIVSIVWFKMKTAAFSMNSNTHASNTQSSNNTATSDPTTGGQLLDTSSHTGVARQRQDVARRSPVPLPRPETFPVSHDEGRDTYLNIYNDVSSQGGQYMEMEEHTVPTYLNTVDEREPSYERAQPIENGADVSVECADKT